MTVVKNTVLTRYEAEIDGFVAFILYRQRDNRVTLVHTEVPPELGGRGIASKLVQATLTQIENSGEKLIPVCPYVRTWLERNPDWKRLLPS